MTMTQERPPREERPIVDPQQLQAMVRNLAELELRDSRAFAERLAECILHATYPVETAAFRSEELAFKSLTAARYLIDNANEVNNRRNRSQPQKWATNKFITLIGRERRVLENIVNGIRARDGVLPNQPNPRQRALRRLADENIKGDVPKGRFRELIIEETEAVKAHKQAEKKRRREERRSAGVRNEVGRVMREQNARRP